MGHRWLKRIVITSSSLIVWEKVDFEFALVVITSRIIAASKSLPVHNVYFKLHTGCFNIVLLDGYHDSWDDYELVNKTMAECQDACLSRFSCRGFEVDRVLKNCWLRSMTERKDWISRPPEDEFIATSCDVPIREHSFLHDETSRRARIQLPLYSF